MPQCQSIVACRSAEHVSSSAKFFARPPVYAEPSPLSLRAIVANPPPRLRRAISSARASHSYRRGTLAAQIPIAELGARPTEALRPRDFVPWRFSDAGRRNVWLGRRCRRPKNCTGPALASEARPQCGKIAERARCSEAWPKVFDA